MSSRTPLAAVLVALALVVVVAPVAIAPTGDRAFADVLANVRPGDAAGAATPDPGPTDGSYATGTRPVPLPVSSAQPPPTFAPVPTISPEPPVPAGRAQQPALRSPIGGTNGRTVRLNLAGPLDYVAQTNLVQCVGASVQMMLNIIKPGANRTAAFQHRLQVQARSLSGPTPPGFVRSGAGVFGWAAALSLRGGGAYRVVGADTLRQAMRMAATAIHDQHRPVGLLVWRGRHAWVMSGYQAVVDRSAPGGFRVTRANILDPLHPYGGSRWGPSPKPGTSISVAAVGRQFVRRLPRRDSLWTAFWRSIAGNAELDGKYVLVLPVAAAEAN
ncbi:MAG TPA: hypothetical protein VGJ17_02775 [Candidatus Limnocylindrales bacterium]